MSRSASDVKSGSQFSSITEVFTELRTRLHGVVPGADASSFTARCPCHDDKTASLSISIKDGRILLHCFAGCQTEGIVRDLGLTMASLFEHQPQQPWKTTSTYRYLDADGNEVFRVLRRERIENGVRKKSFVQAHPDEQGSLVWKTVPDERKVLFAMDRLAKAGPGSLVLVVEGEKDALNLQANKFVATTAAGGANAPWLPQYTEALQGHHVVLLPDNDTAGRAHMRKIGSSIANVAKSLRVLELPGIAEKGDVSDWLEKGGTRSELLDLIDKQSQPWRDDLFAVDQAESMPQARGSDGANLAERSTIVTSHLLNSIDLETDRGNALRLIRLHGHDLHHVFLWKKWIVWDGKRWLRDDCNKVGVMAKETIRRLYHDTLAKMKSLADHDQEDRQEELAKLKRTLSHCLRSESARGLEAMVSLSRNEGDIPLLPGQLDQHPWLLNCPNGTVCLRTGTISPHRREDLLTTMCPVEYKPDARSPTWEHFLDSIFRGDQPLITFMRRMLGRCLTADMSEHLLVVFWGGGGNGKSVLIETILSVLGPDYAWTASNNLLLSGKGDRHLTEVASLAGKRLVIVNETPADRNLNESLAKQLAAGDSVSARRMREDEWEFHSTAKIILVTNHKPRITGTDDGIWRRLRLVPFTQRFWMPGEPGAPAPIPPDRLADPNLKDKLQAEREGILSWLVRGCLEWLEQGMCLPEQVQVATREYRSGENILEQWIEECCVRGDDDYRATAKDLYASYSSWCKGMGENPQSGKSFGDMLTRIGIGRLHSGKTWRTGIALRDGAME